MKKIIKIDENNLDTFKGALIQTVLFVSLFAIIIVGVALESRIPLGFANGMAAFSFVVPATGFMLSLVNWFFVYSQKFFQKNIWSIYGKRNFDT